MKAGDFLACKLTGTCNVRPFLSGAGGSAATNFLRTSATRTFYAGPVNGVACVLVMFGLNGLEVAGLH